MEVADLGSKAAFLEGGEHNVLIVQVGPRVITVAGEGLASESATAIASAAIENM